MNCNTQSYCVSPAHLSLSIKQQQRNNVLWPTLQPLYERGENGVEKRGTKTLSSYFAALDKCTLISFLESRMQAHKSQLKEGNNKKHCRNFNSWDLLICNRHLQSLYVGWPSFILGITN